MSSVGFVVWLLALVSGGSCFQGVPKDDGLTYWTDNFHLEIARSSVVEAGAPLDVVFRWLGSGVDATFTACRVKIGGSVFTITSEYVMNENGEVADGMAPWKDNDDLQICGLTMASYNPDLLTDQTLKMEWDSSADGLLGFAFVSMEEEATSGIRLTKDVYPEEYVIKLMPDNDNSKFNEDGSVDIYFHGHETLTVRVASEAEAQDCLVLQADEMAVMSPTFKNADDFTIGQIGLDFHRTFVYLCDKVAMQPGNSYTVDMDFDVKTHRSCDIYCQYGFYIQQCTPGSSKNCWFTQGESTTTRNMFPSFDEPGFKAVMTAEVEAPEGYSVLANMPVQYQDEGTVMSETTPEMSAYLFALAITDYVGLKSDVRENVTVWCSKEEMDMGRADYAAKIGASVINYYSEYYDVPYTLPKLDLVSEQGKMGAMENWGLVLFAPSTVLLDPELADMTQVSDTRWTVSSVVAHELAHQWFGNLVTCDWWSQTWLNEGFAVYVSYLGAEQIDPENLVWARMVVNQLQHSMLSDSNTNVHWAMTDPVTSKTDVHRKFGIFTYNKGGSVIRMIEGVLTENVLKKALHNYLVANAFEATVEDDLFFYLEQEAQKSGTWPGNYQGDKTFAEVMKTWTDQAGYPVISATVECPTDDQRCDITLSQKMYVTVGEADSRNWTVPLFVSIPGNEGESLFWLEEETTLSGIAKDSPIILNTRSYGYYRVMYDADHWLRIADTIRQDKEQVDVLTRMALLCDALDFVHNGMMEQELFDSVMSAWNENYSQEEEWTIKECGGAPKQESELDWRYRI